MIDQKYDEIIDFKRYFFIRCFSLERNMGWFYMNDSEKKKDSVFFHRCY